jgi:phospholipid/cholesterol/gamma-HCH transport system substrate-binding protein
VLLAVTLGSLGLFALGGRHGLGSGSFRVQVAFADIGGVEVGTRVRVQGIDAGDVEAIVPPAAPGETVRLHLRLAAKYRHLVRRDAQVQLVQDGLLGSKLVRIIPGRADAENVADGDELAGQAVPELADEVTQATGKLNQVLGQVKVVLHEFRQGQGPAGQAAKDMAQAAARLNRILVQADETLQAVQRGEGTLGKLLKNDALYTELTGTLSQVHAAIDDLRQGKGTLGQLVKNSEAYAEAIQSLQEIRKMVASVKQNADAIKSLPVVRNYVIDPHKELVRPHCKRLRRWFREGELFEPGRAVLTDQGKKALDTAGAWLKNQKQEGAEVVVASFAAPGQNAEFAQTLTQKQSEAVADYLKSRHEVHRTGFWWWSRRSLRAVGCGTAPPPVPEAERLPPARVEVLVFVPEK